MGNFKKPVLFTFSSNILLLLLSIILSIIINRALGPYVKGIYTFYITIPLLLSSFLSFGLESSNVYFIGKRKIPVHNLINNSIYFYLSIFIVLSLLFKIFEKNFCFNIKNYTSSNYILYLILIATPLIIENKFLLSILLGLKRYKSYNSLQIIQVFLLIVSFSLYIIFFKNNDVSIFILIWTFSILLNLLIILIFLRKYIKLCKFDFHLFRLTINYSIKNYIANITTFLIYRSDYFVISLFLSPNYLGYYSVATVLSEKLWLIPSSIGTILYPKISAEKKYNKHSTIISLKFTLIIMFFLIIILVLFSQIIITTLYGSSYKLAANIVYFLAPGIFLLSIPKILTADLNGRGLPQYSAIYSFIAFLINLLLNLILIPKIGIIGAAISTSISYFYVSIMILIIYKKITHIGWKEFLINKNDIKQLMKFIRYEKANS
jgi:O-antigen/teichoic acid export membrane protein